MRVAVAESLVRSQSYIKYRKIIADLLADGKVTGGKQSSELLHYTLLNETRMNRLDKKAVISEDNIQKLLALKQRYIWLVISEGWCGDSAQLIPIFNKMATLTPHIDLKIVFRDENEPLMQLFLTNGARAVPKLIVIDKGTQAVCGTWGPRPKGASDLVKSYKQQYGKIDETAKVELQLWYLHDKGESAQNEIVQLMRDVEAKCGE
jgi:hypothetical protein